MKQTKSWIEINANKTAIVTTIAIITARTSVTAITIPEQKQEQYFQWCVGRLQVVGNS